MKKFNLFVDEKVTIWMRSYVTIEADSLEEAVEKCKNGIYDGSLGEPRYDTIKYLTPELNDGNTTLKIVTKIHIRLYTLMEIVNDIPSYT